MFASPTPVDGPVAIDELPPSPLSATSIRTPWPSRRAVIQMSAPSSLGVTAYLIAVSISGWSSSDGRRAPIVSPSILKCGRSRS